MRYVPVALGAALLGCAAANAASPSLNVIVDGIDEEARTCGLSVDALRSQATLTLRAIGLQVASDSTNPFLAVAVAVLFVQRINVCVVSLDVSVIGSTAADMANTPVGAFRSIGGGTRETRLCDAADVSLKPNDGTIQSRLMDDLNAKIKTCIGMLEY